MFADITELKCGVQHYPWGRRQRDGKPPYIADLLAEDPGDQPYAELWIGAHPKLPARTVFDDKEVLLNDIIAADPSAVLGERLVRSGARTLPFLLKVLDCDEPLSIQAHPDRELAEKLHARDPEHYPDAYHKPEIAIALTGMDAFCQFRQGNEIQNCLRRIPPLRDFFAEELGSFQTPSPAWLKAVYTKLFEVAHEHAAALVRATAAHVREQSELSVADQWFLRLLDKYPDDRGTLSAYFLNIIHLDAGEAVFLAADEPHAYLQGTIIECMASSDNVVRAGLTPKFVDTEVLSDMLTYRQGLPQVLLGDRNEAGDRVYKVPVPEFQVEFYSQSAGTAHHYLSEDAISLLLVLTGEVEFTTPSGVIQARKGSTWLWPAAVPDCRMHFCTDNTTVVRARPNMALLPPSVPANEA